MYERTLFGGRGESFLDFSFLLLHGGILFCRTKPCLFSMFLSELFVFDRFSNPETYPAKRYNTLVNLRPRRLHQCIQESMFVSGDIKK
jgi:hypothetical protein